MLKTRVYTVLVLLPLFVAALFYAPPPLWALLLAPLVAIGAWEWGALAGWGAAARAIYALLILFAGALLWFADQAAMQAVGTIGLILSVLFWVIIAPLWLARAWRVRNALVLAMVGAILLLPLWLALVRLHARPAVLLILMAIVWISDTAAYLCGRRWGRRKFAPTISPGKTWEGVFGAVVAVTLYYVLVSWGGLVGHTALQGITGFVVFLLLMTLGIEGDLFESWIKRTAGVKDSGNVLPGHGGVLDRVDALTASVPAAALWLIGWV